MKNALKDSHLFIYTIREKSLTLNIVRRYVSSLQNDQTTKDLILINIITTDKYTVVFNLW